MLSTGEPESARRVLVLVFSFSFSFSFSFRTQKYQQDNTGCLSVRVAFNPEFLPAIRHYVLALVSSDIIVNVAKRFCDLMLLESQ